MAETGDTTSHAVSGRSRRRAGEQRFWKTLPGVITAAAGFISAVAGLIGGLIAAGFITASHPRAALSASSHVAGTGFARAGSSGSGSGGGLSAGGSSGIGSGGGSGSRPGGGSGPSSSPGPGGGPGPSSSPGPGSTSGGGRCIAVATSNASTLQGTYLFDFDSGTQTQSGADVWWDQHTDTVRSLDPWSSATILNLGAVDYESLSCDALRSEAYASTPINGSNDATNQLTAGDVFAVHTDQGNYAKVQVISYGYNLELRFETYQAG